jgi:uncharacterized protein
VFLDLRRRGLDIAWFRSSQGFEVDFIARQVGDKAQLIQVTESLADPRTRQRELRALEAGMSERRHTSGVIVTLEDEEEISTPRGRIRVVPAWRWLLR